MMTIRGRLKSIVLFVRSYGSPTEETIAFPVLSIIVLAKLLDQQRIDLSIAGILLIAIWFTCGVWLGIAGEGFNSLKIALRIVLIVALGVAGYAAITDLSFPKTEYIKFFSIFTSSFGFLFFSGWFFGSSVREISLTPLTNKQEEAIAYRNAKLRGFVMGVLALKEDQMKWEIILGYLFRWLAPPAILLYATRSGWSEIIRYLSVFNLTK